MYVPRGTKAAYESSLHWKDFGTICEIDVPHFNGTLGDANSDGSVDVGDIMAIQSHLRGNTPADFDSTAADADQDTDVDEDDIVTIRQEILQGE